MLGIGEIVLLFQILVAHLRNSTGAGPPRSASSRKQAIERMKCIEVFYSIQFVFLVSARHYTLLMTVLKKRQAEPVKMSLYCNYSRCLLDGA